MRKNIEKIVYKLNIQSMLLILASTKVFISHLILFLNYSLDKKCKNSWSHLQLFLHSEFFKTRKFSPWPILNSASSFSKLISSSVKWEKIYWIMIKFNSYSLN